MGFFRAGHFDGYELTFVVLLPADLHGHHFLDVAVRVAAETLHRREIRARITAKLRGGFFLTVVHLVDARPFGPRIVVGAIHRRLRHDLELRERFAAVARRSRDAVGTGVAAA